VCHVDGYTAEMGWGDIKVDPGQIVRIEPNYRVEPSKKTPVSIDWAECGNLKTRAMNVTAQGPDGLVIWNGKQTRVLNASLYPDIPSHPNGNFGALLDHVVNVFQAAHPEVLLNLVVLDDDSKIYHFDLLAKQFSAAGYDVVELDTLFIGYLASSGLITPVKITGEASLPVALAASTYNGTLYGVPSWLCMDFIFSYSPALKSVHTLNDLVSFVGAAPKGKPALLADYDGSWRMPSIYINAYVQTYGYENLSKAMVMPPDPAVMANLEKLLATCEFNSTNSCVDAINHHSPDGTIERVLANGNATSDMGFSEQSFYILLNQSVSGTVAVIPATWGEKPQALLFSDTFVTNKSSCSSDICQADSAAFTSLMTGVDMKKYVAFSHDLSPDGPPRHLLVANAAFWSDADVKADLIYQQIAPVIQNARPFPNDFSAALQADMDAKICDGLKKTVLSYACN
jgi:hypothetical protein